MPKVEAIPKPCGIDGKGWELAAITDHSLAEVQAAARLLDSDKYWVNVSDAENGEPVHVAGSPVGFAIGALRMELNGAFDPDEHTIID